MSNGISPYMLAGTQTPLIEGLIKPSTQDSIIAINKQKLDIQKKLEQQIELAEEKAREKKKNRFLGIGGELGGLLSKVDKEIGIADTVGLFNPLAGAILSGADKATDLTNIRKSRKELLNVDDRFGGYSWLNPQYEDYMGKAKELQIGKGDVITGALVAGATDYISGAETGSMMESFISPFQGEANRKKKFFPKLGEGIKGAWEGLDDFEFEGGFLDNLQKILGLIK